MDLLVLQLAELENAQLVHRLYEQDLTYLFKHALTQETAYDSLLLKHRREIHRRVAEAYEALYPDQLDQNAAVLTVHYAEAGDDTKTFAYATRAGERAVTISAYTEARTHFTTALEALSRLPDTVQNQRARVDTLIKQTNAAWGIDSSEQNLARLFQAETLAQTLPDNNHWRLARVRYWIGRMYQYRNEHPKAVEYYQQVLTDARESGDQELFGLASALGGRTLFLQGNFGKAAPLLEQAIPYLERIGDWPEWILAKVCLAITLGGQGRYQEGIIQGEEAKEKARALNIRSSLAIAHLMASRVELMAGRPERMLDEVEQWIDEVKATNPLVTYMTLGFQAWGQSRLGRYEMARATMKAADAIATQFGTRLIFADWFAAARAEIELNAGHIAEALRLAEQAVDEAQETGGIFSEGLAQRVWGQALAAADIRESKNAEAHLEKSLALLEEGDAVIEAARTRVALSKVYQARGDLTAARTQIEKAATQFRAAGMESELEETR